MKQELSNLNNPDLLETFTTSSFNKSVRHNYFHKKVFAQMHFTNYIKNICQNQSDKFDHVR